MNIFKMKFSLIKGDIEEFAILEENLPENLDNLFVDSGIRAKLNVKDKRIALINTVKYILNDKSLLKIRSVLYFQIEESSWNELIKEDKIVFEKDKIQHLGIITIGATRGMLIAKCMNTPYSKLILPPININKLLNEDIIFETEASPS